MAGIPAETPEANPPAFAALGRALGIFNPPGFPTSIALGDQMRGLISTGGSSGKFNTYFGMGAGLGTGITNQWANTAIGYGAGNFYEQSSDAEAGAAMFGNTFVGYMAGAVLHAAYDNTGIGTLALTNLRNGNDNTALGIKSLTDFREGSDNAAVGYGSLEWLNSDIAGGTSNRNTAVGGARPGAYLADGVTKLRRANDCCYVGSGTRAGVADPVNETVIGTDAVGGGSNTVTIGSSAVIATRLIGEVLVRSRVVAGTHRFSQIQIERTGIGAWTLGNPVEGSTSNDFAINLNGATVFRLGTGGEVTVGPTAGKSRLETSGSFGAATVSVSADTTLTIAHHTVRVDATTANRTITLPAAVGCTGRIYVIKKLDASANTVTIDANASETIDGATTRVLTTQYAAVRIQSNGVSWDVI